MRKLVAVAVIGLGAAMPATAQDPGVDKRAVEACQALGGTFVQINDCLPDAHVAVVGLDAFDELYPPEAVTIKATCAELNEAVAAAFLCLTSAIDAAVELAAKLPEGSSLGDPVFDAVKSADLKAALRERMLKARESFPEKRIWGGGIYKPYQ